MAVRPIAPQLTDGNFDYSSTINLTDLADVLNNFGQTNPAPGSSEISNLKSNSPTPTPEPASLLLIAGAAPFLIRKRRNRP